MAVFTTNRTLNTGVRSTNFLATLVASFMTWNDRRLTRKALSSLTARELEDIGLNYADISKL